MKSRSFATCFYGWMAPEKSVRVSRDGPCRKSLRYVLPGGYGIRKNMPVTSKAQGKIGHPEATGRPLEGYKMSIFLDGIVMEKSWFIRRFWQKKQEKKGSNSCNNYGNYFWKVQKSDVKTG